MGYVRLTKLEGRALQLSRLGGRALRLGRLGSRAPRLGRLRGPKNGEKCKIFTLLLSKFHYILTFSGPVGLIFSEFTRIFTFSTTKGGGGIRSHTRKLSTILSTQFSSHMDAFWCRTIFYGRLAPSEDVHLSKSDVKKSRITYVLKSQRWSKRLGSKI